MFAGGIQERTLFFCNSSSKAGFNSAERIGPRSRPVRRNVQDLRRFVFGRHPRHLTGALTRQPRRCAACTWGAPQGQGLDRGKTNFTIS